MSYRILVTSPVRRWSGGKTWRPAFSFGMGEWLHRVIIGGQVSRGSVLHFSLLDNVCPFHLVRPPSRQLEAKVAIWI